MSAEDDFRQTLEDLFEDVSFPVSSPMGLVPALPNGPASTFDVDGTTVSAMELATKLSDHSDFPYDDADALIEDIITALTEEDYL